MQQIRNLGVIQKYEDQGECQIRASDQQIKIIQSNFFEDQKIVACAGSGKTTTIILRIKYLIENSINPNQILVFMFNRFAAFDFQRKCKILGCNQKNIYTLDKFAYDIIQQELQKNKRGYLAQPEVKEYGNQLLEYLNTPQGVQNVLSKYKYVFFDEFQDANDIQYQTLMLFKKNGSFISVFGDDSQSLYSWRGSKIEFIQSKIDQDILAETQKQIKIYYLSTNYRSTQSIVQFSNQILKQCDNLLQKEVNWINQQNVDEDLPSLQVFQSEDYQLEQLIKDIKIYMNKFKLSEMAVLCPYNKLLENLEIQLENNNKIDENIKIPYSLKKQQQQQNYIQSDDHKDENKLSLNTFHNSKGLEWKVVFIIGLSDYFFPLSFLRDSQDRLEECKRMFYVACTRARQILRFSIAKKFNYQKNYICRFFFDIDQICYTKLGQIQKNEFMIPNKRKITEKENRLLHIKELIEAFDPQDYNQIQIDEKISKSLMNIHEKTFFDQKVKDLQTELALFVDILIERYVKEKFEFVSGYEYKYAEIIVSTIFWEDHFYQVFMKYQQYFKEIQQFNEEGKRVFIEKSIHDQIDILADDTIYQVRCSFYDIKKSQLFQCLAQAALMNLNEHEIKYIAIYNPINGKLNKYDLTQWNQHEQIIQLLQNVQAKKSKLPKLPLNSQEDNTISNQEQINNNQVTFQPNQLMTSQFDQNSKLPQITINSREDDKISKYQINTQKNNNCGLFQPNQQTNSQIGKNSQLPQITINFIEDGNNFQQQLTPQKNNKYGYFQTNQLMPGQIDKNSNFLQQNLYSNEDDSIFKNQLNAQINNNQGLLQPPSPIKNNINFQYFDYDTLNYSQINLDYSFQEESLFSQYQELDEDSKNYSYNLNSKRKRNQLPQSGSNLEEFYGDFLNSKDFQELMD
ncbi:hypothetical protein ABPG73_011060 [Tetrahymena malaccensis]